MTHPNPFQDSIYGGDLHITPSASAVFYPAQERSLASLIASLGDAQNSGHGRIRMIHSARAGFGKSHLLAQVIAAAQDTYALPISFNRENPPHWQELFRQGIRCLSQTQDPAQLNALSETARLIFAELVSELVHEGIVPTDNPEIAARGLRKNYRSMFDLKNSDSPIVLWFKENFQALSGHLANELRRRTQLDHSASGFWIQFLYRYESGDLNTMPPETPDLTGHEARERMREISCLVSRYRPLILVFDHLDSLQGDTEAATQAAYIFSEIARIGIVPLTIIAMNDDVWQSSFAEKIPHALSDRITDGQLQLQGISIDCARALITERMHAHPGNHGLHEQLFAAINLEALYGARREVDVSPRELLRLASAAWENGKLGKGLPSPGKTAAPTFHGKVPATTAGTHPSTHETLARVRKMLHGVNQRNPGKPELSAKPAERIHKTSPWKKISSDAPPALREFAQQREELYQENNLLLDTAAIRHALELAGRQSPLLDYREFDVVEGSSAACWRSPDHEILFGFEPAECIPYWRALVEQAEESPLTRAKVVAFTPPGAPVLISDGLNGETRKRLDILELDRGALASIAATQKVLLHSDSEEETFAQIAPELDFLWRRITRPMETMC
ncbi:MAG: hypothetical protein VCA55_16530 [Verrucomicrobiales bacterium]